MLILLILIVVGVMVAPFFGEIVAMGALLGCLGALQCLIDLINKKLGPLGYDVETLIGHFLFGGLFVMVAITCFDMTFFGGNLVLKP